MRITFVNHAGTSESVEARSNSTLMEAARQNGVDGILAECGGAATCGTCHVYVDPAWLERLPPLTQDEEDILQMVADRRPNSRLACQVRLEATLDGMLVETPERQELA